MHSDITVESGAYRLFEKRACNSHSLKSSSKMQNSNCERAQYCVAEAIEDTVTIFELFVTIISKFSEHGCIMLVLCCMPSSRRVYKPLITVLSY